MLRGESIDELLFKKCNMCLIFIEHSNSADGEGQTTS